MGKKTSLIFVVFLSFVISYIFSAAFAHYGLNTTNLITGIIIVCLTISAVTLFGKLFPEKTVEG
ncbi:hypothetical protein [Niallia sp. FSL M8-0099]|uniref:hypothetical protein n=1 Tax=Niallia sp. FSL M8-0099 TaxID=2954519 RepID=UPI0011A5F339